MMHERNPIASTIQSENPLCLRFFAPLVSFALNLFQHFSSLGVLGVLARKNKKITSRRDAKRAKEEKQSPTIQPAAFVGQEWLKNETFPPGTLDRAVDRAYRPAPFDSERARVEFLFERYQALTTLFPEKPKKRARQPKT